MHILQTAALMLAPIFLLAGCGPMPVAKTDSHIKSEPMHSAAAIPQPVRQVALPPPPQPKAAEVKYSIVVNDVPVRDVLFAIAKGTNVNIDIHPGMEGRVTLNAIDQTLKQILTRISKQVDMRFETDGPNIAVMPDSAFLKIYKADYVNMSRDTTGSVGVQSQVAGPNVGGAASSSAGSQNSSLLKIDNTAKNRFWETLEKNIKDLLRETDKELPEGSSETFVQARGAQQAATTQAQRMASTRPSTSAATAQSVSPGSTDVQQASERVESRLTFREKASVIVNSETGTIAVRATSRQHEKVSEFLEQVLGSAKRQVLIEATVVEVLLNDNYQSGVDWSALGLQGLGYSFNQSFTGANLNQSPFFSVHYSNPNATSGGSIAGTVKLLSSFGTTRVLSTPRIMTLNNQTAVLKVVENSVYFTIQSQITPGTTLGAAPIVVFTSTPIVVPVGFVMSVTPQISEGDIVVLSVRPNVSSFVRNVNDPNPDLARAGVVSPIPVIQTREFESMLRVSSGQTAILGGLMQDSFVTNRDGLPILSRIPIWGDAASFRNDTAKKSELVIFLRPIVIKEASVDSDLAGYRKYLPDQEFFKDAETPKLNLQPKPNPVVPEATPGQSP
jgi:general secretion pathway protein D